MTQAVIHGVSKHKYYKRWNDMIQRCFNPQDVRYFRYGGAGIEVDFEWDRRNPKGAFNYVVWVEEQVSKLPPEQRETPFLIVRHDQAKNYSSTNCRIMTAIEASQKRRDLTLDFDTVVFLRRFRRQYEEITLREMCELFNIKHKYTLSRCLQGLAWANVNKVEPPIQLEPWTGGRKRKEDVFKNPTPKKNHAHNPPACLTA